MSFVLLFPFVITVGLLPFSFRFQELQREGGGEGTGKEEDGPSVGSFRARQCQCPEKTLSYLNPT